MRPDRSILVVEDDKVDILTINRAFKDLAIKNPLELARNGEEALRYLKEHKDKLPCLILLDINMPIMNGLEFLTEVKQDDTLKMIPVIVLTTSSRDLDKSESFKMSVAGYMIKPVDYNQFLTIVETIKTYWSTSELP